eukprot:TRINITY_DN18095_c0_g1_i1.p1 TRINITY_DN18095_c0_g1~~TRINITY_DN18095_c0_g1_i1.p1  ORF type:complete len:619 (+),score=114.42 TRINITY_DN18095_c0_g1_i1:104-1960(+)
MDQYERLKVLGRGGFGTAVLVRPKAQTCRLSGTGRAHSTQQDNCRVVKEIDMSLMTPEARCEAHNEAEVLRSLSHVNIVRLVDTFLDNNKLCIVMEYADGGDLATLVRQRKDCRVFFDEAEVMATFVQCCLALQHAHSRRILHRDIKCQNIFLTQAGTVKVGDFGIAKVLEHTTQVAGTRVGTPVYAAPEVVDNRPYGLKADMWSMGVVLFEMLALQPPFSARNLVTLVLRILTSEPTALPPQVSDEASQLVNRLLRKADCARPSIDELLKSPLLARAAASLATQLPVRPLSTLPTPAAAASPQDFARTRTFTKGLGTLPGSTFSLTDAEVKSVEDDLRQDMDTQRPEDDTKDTIAQLVGMLNDPSDNTTKTQELSPVSTARGSAAASRPPSNRCSRRLEKVQDAADAIATQVKQLARFRSTSLGFGPRQSSLGAGSWRRHFRDAAQEGTSASSSSSGPLGSKSSSQLLESSALDARVMKQIPPLVPLETDMKAAEKQAFFLASQWDLNKQLRRDAAADASPWGTTVDLGSKEAGGGGRSSSSSTLSIGHAAHRRQPRRFDSIGTRSLARFPKLLPPTVTPEASSKRCSSLTRRPLFREEMGSAACLVGSAASQDFFR